MPKKKPDYIDRGNKHARSGCVNWPTHLGVADSGCYVVSVFLKVGRYGEDPFIRCCDVGNIEVRKSNPDCDDATMDALYLDWREPSNGLSDVAMHEKNRSTGVLAAVTLGSAGAAYWDDARKGAWRCTRADLTPEGEALLSAMEKLYGREAVLVTFVDT